MAVFQPKRMLEFWLRSRMLSVTPSHLMKFLILIPALGLALAASSCRTITPIDPNTMRPSDQCMPHHLRPAPTVHATK